MRIWLAVMALVVGFAVEAKNAGRVYGGQMPHETIAVPLAEAVADPARFGDRPRIFAGTIKQVCQKEGCWMVITDGDVYARVLTGHKFKIPKGSSGPTLVYGTLSASELDAETAEHYAKESGGAKAEAKARQEWRIEATAVSVEE